jgi:hypothetical protein
VRDGGVMEFLALESTKLRAVRTGMMLARVLDRWEDRSETRSRLGKDGGIRRRERRKPGICTGMLRRRAVRGLDWTAELCSTLKPTCS